MTRGCLLSRLALGIVLVCWGGVGSHGLSWICRPVGSEIYCDVEFESLPWWLAAWLLGIPVAILALCHSSHRDHTWLACFAILLAVGIGFQNHFLWELAIRVRHLSEFG